MKIALLLTVILVAPLLALWILNRTWFRPRSLAHQILRSVLDGCTTPDQVSQQLGLDAASLNPLIDLLENGGYLERKPHPATDIATNPDAPRILILTEMGIMELGPCDLQEAAHADDQQ